MIVPLRKDDALLEDIRSAPVGEDFFHVWWIGQSGFLIQWNGQFLLFDPYLSDSLTRKYAETDKPHVRMTELVIDPLRLDMVGLATSSHNHTDHLDAETLHGLHEASGGKLQLVIPRANIPFATERLGDQLPEFLGLNDGESVSADSFELHGITSAHNDLERDEAGGCRFMGFVATFGPFAVYHSGDTLLHEGLVEQLSRFELDLALLPINGNKPERRVAGNLNGSEAAQLAYEVGAGLVVPCHYHMFEFNTEEPDEFVA
ncbi:MAG: MBL fold metallo-hydrolase, partial [Verrucomicrobiota bacterium]